MRVLAAALAALATPALAEIEVHDPYASLAFAGATSASAYMVIHNHGGAADRLLGAESSAAGLVQIHDHVEEDGVQRMVHLADGVALPTDGELVLEPGAVNVMLMGLAPLAEGDTIPVTLLFETAGEVAVEVPVGGGPAAHDH